MGGIVVKQVRISLLQIFRSRDTKLFQALVCAKLDNTYEEIRAATYGIAFFGTPHQGGNHAHLGDIASSIARTVLRNPKSTFIEALKRDSLFADSLTQLFRHQLEDYSILSFFETRSYKKLGIVSCSYYPL